jgi:hypothetical protein
MSDSQLDLDFDLPDPVASAQPRGKRKVARAAAPASAEAPVLLEGPLPVPKPTGPFHYTNAMWDVVRDVIGTLDELRHVDPDRILLSIAQARQSSKHGVYASCVPLRFEGGAQETQVGKRRFRMPALVHQGREILYVVYFMLPRFHEEQDYREKLATIIHELYHISPRFDGDIRRFPGKNFAHGQSRDAYLETSPRAREHAFLKAPFSELLRHPGGVVGLCVTRPRAALVTGGERGRR